MQQRRGRRGRRWKEKEGRKEVEGKGSNKEGEEMKGGKIGPYLYLKRKELRHRRC